MMPQIWHGMVAIVLVAIFLSLAGLVAYLLYGPGITVIVPEALLNFGRGTTTVQATESETTPPPPDLLSGLSGELFECADEKALKAEFLKGSVRLALSDGRKVSLPQTVSASGARYANTNESFLFHTKDYGASVEENGVVTYANCVMRP